MPRSNVWKRAQLKLQLWKVCLTVCKYKGQTLLWNSIWWVTYHLKALFCERLTPIDLTQVVPLYNMNQAQKILLIFHSTRIPRILMQHKEFLHCNKIFPDWVFDNLIVNSLIPELHKSNPLKHIVSFPNEDSMDITHQNLAQKSTSPTHHILSSEHFISENQGETTQLLFSSST